MVWEGWFTLATTLAIVALLAKDRYPPSLVMGGGVTLLLVAGIIDEEGALKGFANEAPVTVAALYILAGAAERTGALDRIAVKLFGAGGGTRPRRELSRILIPSTVASAFVPNTPLVGMLAPRVAAWARSAGSSASLFLMPLAYASVLGGCITIIGTSTNLVVSGLLSDAGMEPLSMFEITPVGLPVALAGVALLVATTPVLLRARRTPGDALSSEVREFTIEMIVADDGPLDGRSVSEAGLRNLEGVYLIALERRDHVVTPVPTDEVLAAGDRLVFAGDVGRVVDLQRMPGLLTAADVHFEPSDIGARRFYQTVIGRGSPLAGATLKSSDFRRRHGAAVVAIHRAGESIHGKLGEVVLRSGDVLLLVGPPGLGASLSSRPDFLVVAPLAGPTPVRREKARIVQVVALALVATAATGVISLLQVSLLAAVALVALKVVTPGEARTSVDLDVILVMATSFGLGVAIADSGLAEQIARGIVAVFEPAGDIGLLAGILVATMIVTELLSNNAAAVMMFPIALATAAQAGLDPRPLVIIILFGASLSFLTPIGYQANTLVWNMGGYRYGDFTKLGAPLTLLVSIMVPIMVPIFFPLR